MSELPNRVAPGDRLTAHWLNRLLDYLRSIVLRPGPGIRLNRTPSGTTISVAHAPAAGTSPPMPFDCRIGPGGSGPEGEMHLYCYVPNASSGLVSFYGRFGSLTVPPLGIDAVNISEDDWLDCGEIESGDSATLQLLVDDGDWIEHKEAACVIDYVYWHVQIGDGVPSGYHLAGPIGPKSVLATLTTDGLHQRNHGFYRADRQQADEDVDSGSGYSSSFPRTLSIAGDSGAMLLLHGFRSPTTISNPYASGGTPPANDNDLLLLVREVSSDRKTVELKYIRLCELAPHGEQGGGGTGPEGMEYPDIPCPSDGFGDAAIWDPCEYAWRSLRSMADVFAYALREKFWPQGGNHANCFGESIGDANGNKVVDLSLKNLCGEWACDNAFDVVGELRSGSNIIATGNISAGGDVIAGGDVVVGSGSWSGSVATAIYNIYRALADKASTTAITELSQRVSALETLLSGMARTNITDGAGNTYTVPAS